MIPLTKKAQHTPTWSRIPLNERERHRGFTLLELMISIAIVAIMVVIIFSAFRISIRAWEKGTENVEENQKIRFVYDILKRQLASVVTNNITNNNKRPYFLRGDSVSLSFVTRMPAVEIGSGQLTIVKYKFGSESDRNEKNKNGADDQNLLYFEKDAVLKIPDVDTGEPSEDPPYILLSGMRSIFFEYLKLDERDELKWQDVWNPDEENAFPLAVRVTLMPLDESDTVTLVARIY